MTQPGQQLREFRGAVLSAFALALSLFVALAEAAEPTLLLTGATVHTVAGPTFTNGQVLIEGARIKAVGTDLAARADRTVDLDGLHLYPGLIAASSTLGLVEIDSVRATLDTTEVGRYTPEVTSWVAVNPDSELIPVARANGITHTLAVPAGGVVAGRSGLIQLDGWTTEQLLVRGPVALHVYWPSMALDLTPREKRVDRSQSKSLEAQDRERKVRLKELEAFFLEAQAYDKALAAGAIAETRRVPAWEAMLPFVRGELPLMIHAEGVREIQAALAWAAGCKLPMILVGGLDAWRLAEDLARQKVPVVYEGVFALPADQAASYAVHFRAARILHEAGVKLAFGTSGRFEASSLRNLPYLAAQAVAFGLPEDVAIRALTLHPAEVMGLGARLGSIEAGKEATLIACDGPILDLRSNVRQMWVAGRTVSLESRHTRLYERYRNRPRSP